MLQSRVFTTKISPQIRNLCSTSHSFKNFSYTQYVSFDDCRDYNQELIEAAECDMKHSAISSIENGALAFDEAIEAADKRGHYDLSHFIKTKRSEFLFGFKTHRECDILE